MEKTAIRIRDIAFTGYPVKAIERARRFYESILHLTPSMVSEDGSWVEYDLNGSAFFIGNFEAWKPSQDGPMVAFEVDEFEQAVQLLKDENVKMFGEIIETPGCWMGIFADPDGNCFSIHKRKSGRDE
jgi:predicted enzyme related to lactoylglutathione lyase